MDDSPGTSERRVRRSKIDKTGRTGALEKLRGLKGSKYKYEVSDVKNVWTDVDEREYSKMVRQRQEDDWIIDDDGQGYVEDGREIFDDEYMESDEVTQKLKRQKLEEVDKRKGKSLNLSADPRARNKDIKSMFTSLPVKKPVEKDFKLENDDLLGDILQDLQKENPVTPTVIKPTVLKKRIPALGSVLRTPPSNPTRTNSSSAASLTPVRTVHRKPVQPRHVTYKEEPELTAKVKETIVEDPPAKDRFSDAFDDDLILDYESAPPLFDEKPSCYPDVDIDESSNYESKVEPMLESNETKSYIETLPKKDLFNQEWDDVCERSVENSSSDEPKQADVIVDTSELPLEVNEAGDQVLRFYWFDAFEDHFKSPGVVYLFGKVHIKKTGVYVSCCLIVRDIERKVFFLPREKKADLKTGRVGDQDVTIKDVHEEVSNLLTSRFKIMRFRSRKVTKRYCFEIAAVPDESDYLEVKYSANDIQLPLDFVGQTFSHVFGTNTSSLEQLILGQKMMGPCWLEIKQPQRSHPPLSWCKVEVAINKPEHVTVLPIKETPPLVLISFGLKTVVNPKTQQDEIVAASCLVRDNFYLDKPAPKRLFQNHFCILTRPGDYIFPFDFNDRLRSQDRYNIEKAESERALLACFISKLLKLDPDIILGHDIANFDVSVLLHRLQVNKIRNWSAVGRLRRTILPKLSSLGRISGLLCGRLLCDVKIMAKELIRSKSYDLTELAKVVLKKDRAEVNVWHSYNSSVQLLQMVESSLVDVSYCLQIIYEINALPLALQITNIAGNVMSRTLLGGRSERNEFLLLHAFTEKGYIVPDKKFGKQPGGSSAAVDPSKDGDAADSKQSSSRRHKAAYSGGLVLEPKKGFYDKYVLLMDFNSLYPSIIQEYNVCFTTVQRTSTGKGQNDARDEGDDIITPDMALPQGILPNEIRKLVESRRFVKDLLRAPDLSADLKSQYDIRQKALKLTANSMYGCLGFVHSRFYAKPLAAFITHKGREILLQTKSLVQRINLDVIYGDTDSLMINTNSTDWDQVSKIGSQLKQEINRLYRHLEIEVDGVFKCILLLKKKKYAALSIQKMPNGELNTVEEIKGVDVVRRDWSQVSCDAGKYVIRQILSGKLHDQILESVQSYLDTLKTEILQDKVSLDQLTITKQLAHNPEDYSDKKAQAHVHVAIRLNSKGGKKIKQGDTVAYVICEDGSNLPATQRAYHIDEMKANKELKIDKKYYLGQQIHPVVSRLCDPFEGMDAAIIAEWLGLDSSSYYRAPPTREVEDDTAVGSELFVKKQMLERCEKFVFNCINPECKQEIIIEGPFRGQGNEIQCVLASCPNPSCTTPPSSYVDHISNLLTLSVKRFIYKYYEGWFVCEDPLCQRRTRKLPLRFRRGRPLCPACGKNELYSEYSHLQLYSQLYFYQQIFDIEKSAKRLTTEEKAAIRRDRQLLLVSYEQLRAVVTDFLDANAYAVVDLTELFGCLRFASGPRTEMVTLS